jgi:hypothetical protein
MADRDHPKTHVEDQKLKGVRKQPLSPQNEGIDPLAESDTLLPRDDTKADSEKLEQKTEKAAVDKLEGKTSKKAVSDKSDGEDSTPEPSLPEPTPEQPPVDNDHVAEGAEQFDEDALAGENLSGKEDDAEPEAPVEDADSLPETPNVVDTPKGKASGSSTSSR